MSTSTGEFPSAAFHIWWRQDQPHEIHLTTTSDDFVSAAGDRPGLWVTFSCNPRSANYSPANFNRAARFLVAHGMAAPPEVEEHNRRLNNRQRLIAWWNGLHADAAVVPDPEDDEIPGVGQNG